MTDDNTTDPFSRSANGGTRVRMAIPIAAFDEAAVRSGEKLPEEVRKAVARGWSVIPQEEQADGRKKPLVKWKPFQMEAPDMRQVERWHSQWPDALRAIVLGQVSGLVVFDFDGPEGVEALDRSRLIPYVRTPGRGGGAHIYVKAPAWPVKTRQQTGIPGVELKAEGSTATFYGERTAGWYSRVARGRIYKPEELPEQYRELLAEAPTAKSAPAVLAGEVWTPQRCASWAMRKLYDNVPAGHLHNGRAATAHVLAIQLRDVPEDSAIETMTLFHEQAGDLNSEGEFEPYQLTEAMETLKHNRLNIPSEWTPGPFAYSGSQDQFEEEVAAAQRRILINETARQRHRNAQLAAEWVMAPALLTLADDLAVERTPLERSVDELHVRGGNTIPIAKYKTGKSTLFTNLLRSFTDGVPFLGRYAVRSLDGRVALWNYELIADQAVDWLRKAEIDRPDRASLWNLRGYRLPLTVPYVQEQAIEWLRSREIEVLMVDPFSRAYTGSENDNTELKQFTEALDYIKREAGVVDLFMAVHMGRERLEAGEERGRGATHLDDWPDNRWVLTRDGDKRYFYAEGRDVLVAEQGLAFDPATKALTVVGGNRRDERARDFVRKVCEVVRDDPGIGQRELRASEGLGHGNERGRYIKTAIEAGLIQVTVEGKKHTHHITDRGRAFVDHKAVYV